MNTVFRALLASCLATFCSLPASAAEAVPFEAWQWDVKAASLLAAQSVEDTKQVSRTLERTGPLMEAVAAALPASGVTQAAMLRFNSGWETVWLLYRTDSKAVLTEFAIQPGGQPAGAVSRTLITHKELAPEKWAALFERFSKYAQKPPTPALAKGTGMLPGRFWPQGYLGVVNIVDHGKSRSYLLATEDLGELRFQGPIDELLCRTLFAGLHCRTGAEVADGWVKKGLGDLKQQEPTPAQQLSIDACAAVQDEKWEEAEAKIKAGADLNGYLRDGTTCVGRARAKKMQAQILWLILHGAAPDKADILGRGAG